MSGPAIRWLRGLGGGLLLGLLAACDRDGSTAAATDGGLPPPGPARPVEIAAPIEKQLANGLRVIVLPRAGSALVAAEFMVLAGGEADPADRAGLADFTASLLAKGTRSATGSRSASELAAAAEALGGSIRADAGWDASRIGITVTAARLAAALDLLADLVRRPAFAVDEVERYRAQAIDGLRLSFSDPGELAPLVAARLVHGRGPYGHPRLGTPASVQRITAEELRSLHRRLYRPDQAVLVLAGGLDPDTGFALAAQVFGDWTASREPRPPFTVAIEAPPEGSPEVTVIDQPDAGQAAVIALLPLPPRSDAGYYDGLVASSVLGGGYSSRLNREIRIKRGLSYSAGADYGVLRNGGAWLASAQTKNASAAEVVGLMHRELARLSAEPVPAEELAARKASYVGGYARRLETAAGIASLIASRVAQGLPADEIGRVIGAVDAVQPAPLQHWAAAHFKPTRLRYVIVGDARQFLAALRRDGRSVEVIPIAELDLESPSLRRVPPKP